ncbi:MAG: S-layer homology domain-containing protein [Oscillospiraceae bacterium]|nr:S-layer homology domain-containing protein [Oscillospiraceae bacterium]
MKRRRFLGLLLALCLACSLLVPTAAAAGRFSDVPGSAYYADAVEWAVGKEITSGTSARTFSPNNTCTRAEMVTFLYRLSGSHSVDTKNPFRDVSSSAYYYDAVLWASTMGITTGVTATEFAPDATVTRAQAVTMLYRYGGTPPTNGTSSFRDVPASAYYKDATVWGKEIGVVAGTSKTTFSPNDPCTRAQIITFLYRFMGAANMDKIPQYPVVLVHGLLGWGSYDQINGILPYWGFTSGAIAPYLREKGVEVYEASMGPVSSAWDSVCELYAQLTGTVTDYGAKHALEHGHDRYGRDYTGKGQYSKLMNGP